MAEAANARGICVHGSDLCKLHCVASHLNDDDDGGGGGGGPLCDVVWGIPPGFAVVCCCRMLEVKPCTCTFLPAKENVRFHSYEYLLVALALGLCIFWLPSASVHLTLTQHPSFFSLCLFVQLLYPVLLLQ